MTTKEIYNKMPNLVKGKLYSLRVQYKTDDFRLKDEARKEAYLYTKALRDCGFITDFERRALFIYTTV